MGKMTKCFSSQRGGLLWESTFRVSGNFGVGAKAMSDAVCVLGFSVAMETGAGGQLPRLPGISRFVIFAYLLPRL